MAQTLPPSPDPSAPLPRYERKRAPAAKSSRPRFQAADAALALLFSTPLLVTAAFMRTGHAEFSLALLTSALTAGMTYLLGWRSGGRLCGIIAGSLTAFSLGFAQAAVQSDTSLLALLVVTALFAFACDATAAACALAGVAAAVRPDGALLGLMLLVLIGVRMRRQLLPGLGAFLAAALVGGSLRVFVLHAPFPAPALHINRGAVSWLMEPAQSMAVWLLVPLCAELTDAVRRVRWLPTAVWGALYLALTFFVHFGAAGGTVLPLMPVVFVLAAGGLSRLMPSLAGELPSARYVLAALAIVGLLVLRGRLEWKPSSAAVIPLADVAAPLPAAVPVAAPPAALVPAAPLPSAVLHPAKVTRPPKLSPPSALRGALAGRALVKKPLPKPAVALYTLRNGRLVRRTKWAVQWDLAHPKTKP